MVLVLVGCELGNPAVVFGPDAGDRSLDVAQSVDVAADVGGDQGVGDDAIDAAGGGDVADVTAGSDVALDLGDDLGALDAGVADIGVIDVAGLDTGTMDAGSADSGVVDTGPLDTGPSDLGFDIPTKPDTGPLDTGPLDTGPLDTGPLDTGPLDTGPLDTGPDVPVIPDTGPPDAGTTVITAYSESCAVPGPAQITGPGSYAITGSTVSRANDHRPSCTDDTSIGDVGYLVRLSGLSRLTWSARPTGTPAFTPVIYITQGCQSQASGDSRFVNEVACVSNVGADALTRGGAVDLPAGDYYFVVDGAANGSAPTTGAFEVTLNVVAVESSRSYSVERVTTRSCSTIPSGANIINDGDDVVSTIRTLPFSFRYFGTPVTRFAVYTNGLFTFLPDTGNAWSATTSWRNHSITFNGPPAGIVAPFWDDLIAASGGSSDIHQWVDGTISDRVAHFYWEGVQFFWSRSTTVTFEVKLFETSNIIEFAYCTESPMNTYSRGGSATVGIESLDQTAGVLISLNSNTAIAPNTGYRFLPR